MTNNKTEKTDEPKLPDEGLQPISIQDLVQRPTEELQETSPKREWEIKKLMEQLGVSREIAEKMVDETHGAL